MPTLKKIILSLLGTLLLLTFLNIVLYGFTSGEHSLIPYPLPAFLLAWAALSTALWLIDRKRNK